MKLWKRERGGGKEGKKKWKGGGERDRQTDRQRQCAYVCVTVSDVYLHVVHCVGVIMGRMTFGNQQNTNQKHKQEENETVTTTKDRRQKCQRKRMLPTMHRLTLSGHGYWGQCHTWSKSDRCTHGHPVLPWKQMVDFPIVTNFPTVPNLHNSNKLPNRAKASWQFQQQHKTSEKNLNFATALNLKKTQRKQYQSFLTIPQLLNKQTNKNKHQKTKNPNRAQCQIFKQHKNFWTEPELLNGRKTSQQYCISEQYQTSKQY